MKNEIKRRIKILDEKTVPVMTAQMLRGGMQERLHRRELLSHGMDVREQKSKLKKKLHSIIEREENEEGKKTKGFMSTFSAEETLEDFREPVLRKIRSRRGFF